MGERDNNLDDIKDENIESNNNRPFPTPPASNGMEKTADIIESDED